MYKPLALVIEDDQALCRAYQRALTELGYNVELCQSIAEARAKIRDLAPALILVDIELPDGNGLDLMNELRNSTRERFIVISGNSSQRAAIKSIRHRAVTFVSKPVSLGELKRLIGTTVPEAANGIDQTKQLISEARPDDYLPRDDCWINHGNSPALVKLRTAISYSAELRKGHALIVGEKGLEKRSIAVELHRRSRRSGKIVFLDCKAKQKTSLQEMLFGVSPGSNDVMSQTGCIEAAAGGTLVLENVNSVPDDLQSALSLFLDTGIFKRAECEQGYKAVVAVVGIVSDHAGVDGMRSDLTARLSQVTLHVPSLRECTGDVLSIAQWLLTQTDNCLSNHTMSVDMSSRISAARWPLNVCELRKTLQAAVDYSIATKNNNGQLQFPSVIPQPQWEPFDDLVGLTLRDFGKKLIVATLAHYQGDKAKAAATLGISLKTLYNRLNSY